MKEHRDMIKASQASLLNEYNRSQKHVSEKFQHFLNTDKSKAEDPNKPRYSNMANLHYHNKSNSPFDGRIQGNSLNMNKAKIDKLTGGYQKRYAEDLSDYSKQGGFDSSLQNNLNAKDMIMAVHESQQLKNSEGLIDIIRRNKHNSDHRGHSIVYNPQSDGEYYQNMKEQMTKSRPTSSSSNFM